VPVLETAQVISADGTRVCFRTLGDGPPLVVAHAAFATSDDYVPLAVRLATTFRVVLVDRRGYRGTDVGPGPATFGQDAEDLAAIMGSLGARCGVFGHSAGAQAALHAARSTPELVVALALYEPALRFSGPARQPLLDRFRALRAAGEDAEALVTFMTATGAVGEDAIRMWIDGRPLGARVSGVVDGVGRDLEAAVALTPELEPWARLAVPVTLLVGTERRTEEPEGPVLGALPRARTLALPGQEHLARALDPRLLADAIRTVFRT
jgi:pimeloyl-ACP methyl ester carboxylesterase